MECSLTDSQFFDRLPCELLGPICAPLDSLSLVRLKRCGDRRLTQFARRTEKELRDRGDLDPIRTLSGFCKETYSLGELDGMLAVVKDGKIMLLSSDSAFMKTFAME